MPCYSLKKVRGTYKNGHEKFVGQDFMFEVPCGKCAFCAVQKRSDWALRLNYEAKLHTGSKFVTLTYADAHLKFKEGRAQLDKEHLQEFFREYRRGKEKGKQHKMRYFAVGEYGSKTMRPHYHVIMFGEIDEDRVRKVWKKGHVHIGSVTQASVMYCLGYVCNAKAGKMVHKRVPPFTLMSKRPGLGANYLSKQMVDWHRSDRKNYAILDGEKRHLPRYYKNKIFSPLDLVRISVRDQKLAFQKEVAWLRSPKISKMRDPIAYRNQQRLRAAVRISRSFKQNLTI